MRPRVALGGDYRDVSLKGSTIQLKGVENG